MENLRMEIMELYKKLEAPDLPPMGTPEMCRLFAENATVTLP